MLLFDFFPPHPSAQLYARVFYVRVYSIHIHSHTHHIKPAGLFPRKGRLVDETDRKITLPHRLHSSSSLLYRYALKRVYPLVTPLCRPRVHIYIYIYNERRKKEKKEKEITSIFPRFPSPRGIVAVIVVVVEKGPSVQDETDCWQEEISRAEKKLILDYGGFPRIFSLRFFFFHLPSFLHK